MGAPGVLLAPVLSAAPPETLPAPGQREAEMGTPLPSPQFALYPGSRLFVPQGFPMGSAGCARQMEVGGSGHSSAIPRAQPRGAGSQDVTPVLLVATGMSQSHARPKHKLNGDKAPVQGQSLGLCGEQSLG